MLWLIGLCAFILFAIFAKRIVIFFISWTLARLLKCSSVKYGRVGIFSVTDIKLRFNSFIVEVDKVWLSSSFFNQDYTKPLVLCFNDVRLEVSKICPYRGDLNNSGQKNVTQQSSEQTPIRQRLKRFSTILQYLSANVNNLNVVLMDVVLPDCLVHLAVEEITLDTFRDRESIQCDLIWKLLTCKMLQRSSAAVGGSSTDLLQISAGANLTVHFDPVTYLLKLSSIKTSNPVFALSDGFFKVVQHAKKRKTSRRQLDPFAVGSQTSVDLKDFLPQRVGVEFKNATFNFLNAANSSKQLNLSLKSLSFDLNRSEYFATSLNFADMNCTDGETLSLSCSSFQSSLKKDTNDVFVECYVTTVTGSTNFDGIYVWNESLTNTLSNLRSSDGDVVDKDVGQPVVRALHVEFELSSLNFGVGLPDEKQISFNVEFISFNCDSVNNFEVGVEALSVSFVRFNQNSYSFEDGSKFHHRGHILQLGAFLLKLETEDGQKRILNQMEQFHLEWNLEFLKYFVRILNFLPLQRQEKQKTNEISTINVQAKFTDVVIFIPIKETVCAVLAADECRTVATGESFVINFVKLKLFRKPFDLIHPFSVSFDQPSNDDSSRIEKLRVSFKKKTKELSIGSDCEVFLTWSTMLHMIVVDTMRESKKIFDGFFKLKSNPSPSSVSMPLQLKIYSEKKISVHFNLPSGHSIEFVGATFKLYRTTEKRLAETKQLTINFDAHAIFVFDVFLIKRLSSLPKMDEFRRAFVELSTKENALWLTKIEKVTTIFPYEYNFAETYEECLNIFKWIKKIHGRKTRPFSPGCPLPCDLLIQIQQAYFEMCDDPFEIKMRDNYELLMDEHFECERRQQIMDQKIEELRKAHPLLQRTKVDELYASLQKRNSNIYIQRSKQLYSSKPSRTTLFNWKLVDLEIKALADETLHGEENCVKQMQSMNPESVWPPNIDFNTLWCRHVGLDFKEWLMEMRDYPQPYWSMTDGHFWGRLAGAEVEGNDRAKRSATVVVGAPFGEYVVFRNMPPLKFYYDLCSNIKLCKNTYGPCWEPCLAMINQCFDKINKPSADPSTPLPFWDKMRLLMHGRLSMMIDQYVAAMLASSDPYDTTEQLEWTWTNFEFDWTNGVILVMSDLDTYVRTASKYDDCCLLHLPGLKLQ